MKTVKDYTASSKAQTISEIVGFEVDTTGCEFLNKPFCHFICQNGANYFIEYKACFPHIEELKNNTYRVIIFDDYVDFVDVENGNSVVEL